MRNFGKHFAQSIVWLLLSEILCLILAFSVAILRNPVIVRGMGLLFGITAHILLTASCAQKAAAEDAVLYRTEGIRMQRKKPLLLAFCTMLPAYLTYLLLRLNADSVLMLNLFPLLNAPFIQLYRILIDNTEPFSAIPAARQMMMALPPLVTAASYFTGYQLKYLPELAKTDAKTLRS